MGISTDIAGTDSDTLALWVPKFQNQKGIDISSYIKHSRSEMLERFSEPELPAMRIIDEQDISLLIMIREANLNNCFMVGDIANKYIMAVTSSKMRISPDDLYNAIGRLCGKSARTIRYYSAVAAFYSDDARRKYEALPFSFFAYSMEFGNEYQHPLDVAMLNPQISLQYLKNLMIAEKSLLLQSTQEPEINVGVPYREPFEDNDDEIPQKLGVSSDAGQEKNKVLSGDTAKLAQRDVALLCTLVGDMTRRVVEMAVHIDDETIRGELVSATETMRKAISKVSDRYIYGIIKS